MNEFLIIWFKQCDDLAEPRIGQVFHTYCPRRANDLLYIWHFPSTHKPLFSHPQEEFEEESVIPLDVMPLNAVGQTFTVLRRPEGSVSLGKTANILKFKLKEIDPSTGEPPPPPSQLLSRVFPLPWLPPSRPPPE